VHNALRHLRSALGCRTTSRDLPRRAHAST
jgi:hypothetical protein